MTNPFRYSIPVEFPFFTNREQELKDFERWLTSGQNLVVHSPKGYGKTSLINKVLKNLSAKGYNTVYVNFLKVHSQLKFAELYLKSLIQNMPRGEQAVENVSKLMKNTRAVCSFDTQGNLNISVQNDEHKDISELGEIFDLPQKLDADKPWVIVFDEFNEIDKLRGDSFEKQLKSSMKHHANVSYVFMESKNLMFLNMFTDPERALHKSGKIYELKKMPENYMVDYLKKRFISSRFIVNSEFCNMIVDVSNNIPHYVQYLASATWEKSRETNKSPDDSILVEAINKVVINQNDYFLQILNTITPYQQKVLKSILEDNKNIFTSSYIKKHKLTSASSVQRAVERLLKEEIVEKNENEYLFSDPFFKIWLEEN